MLVAIVAAILFLEDATTMSEWTYTPDPNFRSARVEDQGRSRRVRYQVTTTDKDATEADIQRDSGFSWGDTDPLDSTKFIRSIEVNRDGTNPYYWELILEYRSNVIPGYSEEQSQIPPLERPPEFDWSFENRAECLDRDADGEFIGSVIGELFDPPIQREYADLVATVSFYSATWNAAVMLSLVNCTNSDLWYGWPAETVLFRAPRARLVVEPPWPPCYHVTYIFACRPDTWRVRVLHAGYKCWSGELNDDGTPTIIPVKDDNGQAVETPRPLDEQGRQIRMLANGQFEKPLVWKRFKVYPAIAFSIFGL